MRTPNNLAPTKDNMRIRIEELDRELARERALADRLAAILQRWQDACGTYGWEVSLEIEDAVIDALAAHKERRTP